MERLLYYAIPIALVGLTGFWHARRKRRQYASNAEMLREMTQAGLNEPPTLHPVVDLSICMGSGACARSCPEKALGVIRGKAVLINAAHCIGHGACAAA
jgi:ferredoxin